MSGKFMRVKRFIIPTLTAVIIASQLMGCAAMTQSELLQAINNGDQIEIEVIEHSVEQYEQGQQTALSWTFTWYSMDISISVLITHQTTRIPILH